MPITRAKATALLNQKEMALYDDSRANAAGKLDVKAVSARIKRARDARDRSRDLVQRQKLSSRDRTGNKRGTSGQANQRSKDKSELMTDILRRFEARLKEATREEKAAGAASGKSARTKKTTTRAASGSKPAAKKKSAAKKPARKATGSTAGKKTGKTASKKTASKKASAKKVAKSASKKTASKKTASKAGLKKTASKKATTKKTAAKKAAKAPARKAAKSTTGKKTPARKKSAAAKKKRALTPKQALKKTMELLEAKQQRDRAPKPWETLGQAEDVIGKPGFQSDSAASRAQDLHAGEVRLPAIKGSISTRDRINQGKRDRR